MIIAILIVISIQSIGLFGLQSIGLVVIPYSKFLWLATIIGGILFGSGMALAGSCSTGTYYRTAEGLIGSIIAVIGFIIASWFVCLPASKSFFFFFFFSPITSQILDSGTIMQTFHVSPYIIIVALISLTIYLSISHIK
ncbi:MAG: YeeE/YedE thiosulfate transporter family protein [Arsenophonus endosymbiont of Dermacentor nuttalli]